MEGAGIFGTVGLTVDLRTTARSKTSSGAGVGQCQSAVGSRRPRDRCRSLRVCDFVWPCSLHLPVHRFGPLNVERYVQPAPSAMRAAEAISCAHVSISCWLRPSSMILSKGSVPE